MDYSVRYWDAATINEIKKFSGHETYVITVSLSPDGKLIASRD